MWGRPHARRWKIGTSTQGMPCFRKIESMNTGIAPEYCVPPTPSPLSRVFKKKWLLLGKATRIAPWVCFAACALITFRSVAVPSLTNPHVSYEKDSALPDHVAPGKWRLGSNGRLQFDGSM